ncbi:MULTISPECIES: ATP-binding protein [Streptomyces]|uniref:Putative regulatory protein n=1 Tax=Streptomyces albus (strain ATCC 21838 / DSM 41398 / FERM P-419 / JCM 4703 / NBRC 107858) TaxID=1081613 RepID=A0A0B5EQR8_STRA4|nr:ATP-binding protein [Streptomyces sp. SCSIO ZS0520]AJE85128.1 putative regulatory protein [Streptomyces albus]AOU79434.1 putative regulatory protein [Streptomyces albus]
MPTPSPQRPPGTSALPRDRLPLDVAWMLPRHPRSVGRARRRLREQLDAWKVPEALTETAALLLSELMTNAYQHARATPGREILTRCELSAERLRIEVSDAGDTLPEPRTVTVEEESGRGLALVAALSDNWGAQLRSCGIGKTVWCEWALPRE